MSSVAGVSGVLSCYILGDGACHGHHVIRTLLGKELASDSTAISVRVAVLLQVHLLYTLRCYILLLLRCPSFKLYVKFLAENLGL